MKDKREYSEVIICLLLIITTLIVYGQVQNHEFNNFDDILYITNNSHIQNGFSLKGVIWSFTKGTNISNYWHPLTWMSHMLDCQLYGLNPMGHHWTNLLIHLTNVICLFFVFLKMTKDLLKSGFIAALFALHPLHVESVAWVAERKDVLCTLFWFLSMWAYVGYVEVPGFKRYLFVILFFILGLMSKPMIVTLPFVMILLDYWPLGRCRFYPTEKEDRQNTRQRSVLWLIIEKIPLFLLTGISSFAAFVTQKKGGALAPLNLFFLKNNVFNAIVSYVKYIGKTIWPSHLSVFYPYPDTLPVWKTAFAFLLLTFLSIFFIQQRRKFPYLIVGWLWYLGTLVPVIGLIRIGSFSMADRYTYVPIIGLFIIVTWGVSDFWESRHFKKMILSVLSGMVLSICMVCTWTQVGYWRNSISLFEHAVNVTDKNWMAHNNLGKALAEKGKINDAIFHFKKAIKIKPDYIKAINNLGAALTNEGRLDDAVFQYEKVLKIRPDSPKTLYDIGRIMYARRKIKKAAYYFEKALKLNPEYGDAHHYLAILLSDRKEFAKAIFHYKYALKTKPNDPNIHWNFGEMLMKQGKFKKAMKHFTRALVLVQFAKTGKINSQWAELYNQLGNIMAERGKFKEAGILFLKAIQINPDYKKARDNLESLRKEHE